MESSQNGVPPLNEHSPVSGPLVPHVVVRPCFYLTLLLSSGSVYSILMQFVSSSVL